MSRDTCISVLALYGDRPADYSQGTEGKVIRGAKDDGTLSRGRVQQFFIGIHSVGNLNDIRVDLAAAGYDVLCVHIAFLYCRSLRSLPMCLQNV